MKNNSEKRDISGAPQADGDHVLGKLTPGNADTELKQSSLLAQADATQQPVSELAGLHKTKKKETSQPATGATATTPQPVAAPGQSAQEDDKLMLPKGALVAMRKSGGLRFTSVQITIYNNGNVQVERSAAGTASPQPRRLRDKDLAKLYRALGAAKLPELAGTVGRDNPDAYSYEIAADLGQTTYNVTTFDGSIPAQLSPLIQLLSQITNNNGQ